MTVPNVHLVKDEATGAEASNDGPADQPLLVREPLPPVHHGRCVGETNAGSKHEGVAEHESVQVGRERREKDSECHDRDPKRGCCLLVQRGTTKQQRERNDVTQTEKQKKRRETDVIEHR